MSDENKTETGTPSAFPLAPGSAECSHCYGTGIHYPEPIRKRLRLHKAEREYANRENRVSHAQRELERAREELISARAAMPNIARQTTPPSTHDNE
jgi:hypothetical protein